MSSHTLDRIIAANSKTSTKKEEDKSKERSETNWYVIGIAIVALLILVGFAYYYFWYSAKPEVRSDDECILDEMKHLAEKNRGVPRTYAEGVSSLEEFRNYSRTHSTYEL